MAAFPTIFEPAWGVAPGDRHTLWCQKSGGLRNILRAVSRCPASDPGWGIRR